jgi:hypothetical protein
MIEITPKQAFQKSSDDLKAFHAVVDSPVFHEGVHKAIAEFVLFSKPTAEELEGVRRFLAILVNMAEKDEPQKRAPIIRSIAELTAPKPKPLT